MSLIAMLLASMLVVGTAGAAPIVEYRFEFTAADLLNNVFSNGIDGTTAAGNVLYEGARLLRVGTSSNNGGAGRTFIESQHDNFVTRWNQYVEEGYVFDYFNLWGMDGKGANWGEDYKPYQWGSLEGPNDWQWGFYNYNDLWSNPPAGSNTLDFPWWYEPKNPIQLKRINNDGSWALDEATAAIYQAYLESYVFSFTIKFDPDDQYWEKNLDPLVFPSMTLWFGGYLQKDNYASYHIYEGNFASAGQEIPEPGTLLLLGTGLLGLVYRRRRAQK